MLTNLSVKHICPKAKKAFTLVEAMIAIIFLAICGLALFASLHTAFYIVSDIRDGMIATTIIQEEMEDLRKTFFSSLPPYGESTFSNDSLSLLYNASGTIKADEYIDSNIVRVVVIVIWYSRLNTNKQNTSRAATLIAKNGINSI